MKTADEINIKSEAGALVIANLAGGLRALVDEMTQWISADPALAGREVSARRARKLRKRGEHCRFHRNTSTGKARYVWTKTTWVIAAEISQPEKE